MPDQPKTKARTVRVDDEMWEKVRAQAQARGLTATDVVREALHEKLEGKQ